MSEPDPGEDLQILAMFHWAMAFLIGMAALVPLAWLVIDRRLRDGGEELLRTPGAAASDAGMMAIAAGLLTAGLALGIVVARGAFLLARRERWTYCVAASALMCLFFPFGTLLGGLTLGRLLEPRIREAFGARSATPG